MTTGPRGEQVGGGRPGPAALSCHPLAPGPARKAQGRRRPPRPPPTARGTSGLSGGIGPRRSRRRPAPVQDHSFQRAARDAPRVTLGPASRVPSERAGTAPRRPCRATDRPMSWATPSFHRVLHLSSARAEDMVAVLLFLFFFNLSCSSKTRVPLNWASTVYLSPESGYREVNKRAREG